MATTLPFGSDSNKNIPFGGQPTSPQQSTQQTNLADTIWNSIAAGGNAFLGIGKTIQNAATGGIQQIQQGYQDATQATNPLTKTEAGLKILAGGVNTAGSLFAPILQPTVGSGVNVIADKIADIPAVQQFATSDAGNVASRIAEDTLNTATVLPVVGGLTESTNLSNEAGGVVKNVNDTVSNLKAKTQETYAPTEPNAAATTLKDAVELTKPTLSKNESISALERSGQPGGATTGSYGKYEVSPSTRDVQVAQSVQGVVSRKAGPIENIANINGKIQNVSETQVRPFLQQNPSPFNLKTLNAYIRDNTEMPNYIKADPVLERTYELTRQSMMEEVARQPKTLEGLWDSRIAFDHVAERQVGNLNPADVKVSVIKQAVLDTRRAVNDYIAENAKNGDQGFTQQMQLMNKMYEARGNIAEANYKLLGKNAIIRWMKENPGKAAVLKKAGALIGLGLGVKAVEGL